MPRRLGGAMTRRFWGRDRGPSLRISALWGTVRPAAWVAIVALAVVCEAPAECYLAIMAISSAATTVTAATAATAATPHRSTGNGSWP